MDIRTSKNALGNTYKLYGRSKDIRQLTGLFNVNNFAGNIISKYGKPSEYQLPDATMSFLDVSKSNDIASQIEEMISQIFNIYKTRNEIHNDYFKNISIDNAMYQMDLIMDQHNDNSQISQLFKDLYQLSSKTDLSKTQLIDAVTNIISKETSISQEIDIKKIVEQGSNLQLSSIIRQYNSNKSFNTKLNNASFNQWSSSNARNFFWKVQRLSPIQQKVFLNLIGDISLIDLQNILCNMSDTSFTAFSNEIYKNICTINDLTLQDNSITGSNTLISVNEQKIKEFVNVLNESNSTAYGEVNDSFQQELSQSLNNENYYYAVLEAKNLLTEISNSPEFLTYLERSLFNSEVNNTEDLNDLSTVEQTTNAFNNNVIINENDSNIIKNDLILHLNNNDMAHFEEFKSIISEVLNRSVHTDVSNKSSMDIEQMASYIEQLDSSNFNTLLRNILDTSVQYYLSNNTVTNSSNRISIENTNKQNISLKNNSISDVGSVTQTENINITDKRRLISQYFDSLDVNTQNQIKDILISIKDTSFENNISFDLLDNDQQTNIINELSKSFNSYSKTEFELINKVISRRTGKTTDIQKITETVKLYQQNIKETKDIDLLENIIYANNFIRNNAVVANEMAESIMNLSVSEWNKFTEGLKSIINTSTLSKEFFKQVDKSIDKIDTTLSTDQVVSSEEKRVFLSILEHQYMEINDLYEENKVINENTILHKFSRNTDLVNEETDNELLNNNKFNIIKAIESLDNNEIINFVNSINSKLIKQSISKEQTQLETISTLHELITNDPRITTDIRKNSIHSVIELNQSDDISSIDTALTYIENIREKRIGLMDHLIQDQDKTFTEFVTSKGSIDRTITELVTANELINRKAQAATTQEQSAESLTEIKQILRNTQKTVEENTEDIEFINRQTSENVTNTNSNININEMYEKLNVQEKEIEKLKQERKELIQNNKSESYYTKRAMNKINEQLRMERLRRGL